MSGASLYWIPLLPLLGAVFNLFLGRVIWKGVFKSELPRGLVHAVAVGTVGFAFLIVAFKMGGPLWDAWAAWNKGGKAGNPGFTENVYTWIETGWMMIELAFTLDLLILLELVVIDDAHIANLHSPHASFHFAADRHDC